MLMKQMTFFVFSLLLSLTADPMSDSTRLVQKLSGVKINVALIGDSTVCNYPADSSTRGWGEFFPKYFKTGMDFTNHAMGGRSTKTFIEEGRWEKTLALSPDLIFIQFGHNDSHAKDKPESTDASTDYQDFLRKYIDEARAGGVVPIFVTPVHRRIFTKEGKMAGELKPYADAMKKVAAEKNVMCLDLFVASGELFQKLGDEGSGDLSCSEKDRTHFSAKGAETVSKIVLDLLLQVEPKFKNWLRK